MADSMLEVENVHKSFGDNKVLDGVSFALAKGDVFGFLGPNGAGKTTTVRVILGLVRPDRGTVAINGHDLNQDFKRAISCVGAVVESPSFYNYLTGYRNLSVIGSLHGDVPKDRVKSVLETVGLAGRAHDPVGTYSLGMKQRLGIARTLIHDPDLIFLDEPMNGLDPQGIADMRHLIAGLAKDRGITFFITSHLLHEVEQICSRVAVLHNRRILMQGAVDALLAKDGETVEICAESPDACRRPLDGARFVKSYRMEDGRLVVEVDGGMSGELNRLLVLAGIDVRSLVPRRQSLESYYMNLIRGDGQ